MQSSHAGLRIWGFAFGYFAAYVPYTLFTKSVTSGLGVHPKWNGVSILPVATLASIVGMALFLVATGWWKLAPKVRVAGFELPRPRLATFMSGVATSAIVLTTTLAYTFDGISVIFAMLLMRGGVLMLAPIVDQISGRPASSIPWWSWAGSGLALVSLVVSFAEDGGSDLTAIASVNIAIYLAAYFVRLRWMSRLAKVGSGDARQRRISFFVEEQIVATPFAMLVLVICALAVPGPIGDSLRAGFTDLWAAPTALLFVVALGVCSQFTGVFGALILLEPQENAYTVPVNRASSVLAGVVSSYLATAIYGVTAPSAYEVIGAFVIIAAIVVLSYPTLSAALARRRAVTETSR